MVTNRGTTKLKLDILSSLNLTISDIICALRPSNSRFSKIISYITQPNDL